MSCFWARYTVYTIQYVCKLKPDIYRCIRYIGVTGLVLCGDSDYYWDSVHNAEYLKPRLLITAFPNTNTVSIGNIDVPFCIIFV